MRKETDMGNWILQTSNDDTEVYAFQPDCDMKDGVMIYRLPKDARKTVLSYMDEWDDLFIKPSSEVNEWEARFADYLNHAYTALHPLAMDYAQEGIYDILLERAVKIAKLIQNSVKVNPEELYQAYQTVFTDCYGKDYVQERDLTEFFQFVADLWNNG